MCVMIDFLIGSLIESRYMGNEFGLLLFVVLGFFVFWGWVLGLVGMFFLVFFIMMVKVVLESNEEMCWVVILMGCSLGSSFVVVVCFDGVLVFVSFWS